MFKETERMEENKFNIGDKVFAVDQSVINRNGTMIFGAYFIVNSRINSVVIEEDETRYILDIPNQQLQLPEEKVYRTFEEANNRLKEINMK